MSFVGDFLGDTIGGVTGAKQAGEAAEKAGKLQAEAAEQGISEQRRQFDKLVELMAPYVTAGVGSMAAQRQIIGLDGSESQQQAISALEASPLYQAQVRQGEEALLQQASATGGLRGGNVQAALAQFRPQMLQQAIEQQYSRLGGLTQLGQASAAGQASAGIGIGENVANLLAQRGAALAGGAIGKGGIARQTFQDVLQIANTGIKAASSGAF